MTMTDCVVLDGKVTSMPTSSSAGNVTVNSGVYSDLSTGVKLAEGSEDKASEYLPDASNGPKVIIGTNTAAVVKGEDGVRTYSDLTQAVKANKDNLENIQLLKKDLTDDDKAALEKLEVKFENGVLSKVEKPIVGPGTTPLEPVTPILPVFPEGMDIASAPASSGTTAIEDEAVPLAGLTPLGELVSYLYTHEGSPDGKDAEGEYTFAMAWAIAKEIVSEDADPEEIVTGSILRDVMTAYAELLDTTFDVEIKADDDAPVMNCGEILADFFEAREAKTK